MDVRYLQRCRGSKLRGIPDTVRYVPQYRFTLRCRRRQYFLGSDVGPTLITFTAQHNTTQSKYLSHSQTQQPRFMTPSVRPVYFSFPPFAHPSSSGSQHYVPWMSQGVSLMSPQQATWKNQSPDAC